MNRKAYVRELFNGNNFFHWKIQIEAVFAAKKLLSVVKGDLPRPSGADATEAAKSEWDSKDAKAKSIVYLSIEESISYSLIDCETSSEIWRKLTSRYEKSSAQSALTLRAEFNSVKMTESDTLQGHLAKVMFMAKKIKSLNMQLDDQTIIAQVLYTMLPKYNHLITIWESRAGDKQKVSDLDSFIFESERRENFLSSKDDAPTASG